jgi:hypothetical protein
MATYEHELTSPPKDARERELWLQHAAGFILFRDSRAYAVDRIDPGLDPKAHAAVVKGIDDALYGLMMIVDGVSGQLSNDSDEISIAMLVRHSSTSPSGDSAVIEELDLQNGDGMCMGIHDWRAGDFGKLPPAAARDAGSALKPAARQSAKKSQQPVRAKKRRKLRSPPQEPLQLDGRSFVAATTPASPVVACHGLGHPSRSPATRGRTRYRRDTLGKRA